MGELDPCPFAIEAGERIVRSLRANLFFTAGWEQIDRGVGKAYFERLFTEIVKDAYRRSKPANEPLTLEQLREMGNMAVWAESDDADDPRYGAYIVDDRPEFCSKPLVNCHHAISADEIKNGEYRIYRRPPERSKNDA